MPSRTRVLEEFHLDPTARTQLMGAFFRTADHMRNSASPAPAAGGEEIRNRRSVPDSPAFHTRYTIESSSGIPVIR